MDRRERKKDLSTDMNLKSDMDVFLDKLGLYRKPIAKDGSCLFRAVAEQIFNCQAEHLRVRKECIEYMKKNKERFEAFVEGPFDHHLFNLRNQMEWAGQVEIQALSMMYKCDFLVYKDINSVPIKATENNYKDKEIMLCYSNGNHYDSIYTQSRKKDFAFCQSLVFELLYEKVLPHLAIKDPENKATSPTDENSKQVGFGESSLVNGYGSGSEIGGENDQGWTTVKSKKQGKMLTKKHKSVDNSEPALLSPSSAKRNWEVMRSIDPDHYRNIELEVWEESRKEQQQKDQAVAATIQFKKGERCQGSHVSSKELVFRKRQCQKQLLMSSISNLGGRKSLEIAFKHPYDEKFYTAIIDDVFEEKCKIWIPELKERTVVPFSRLKPKEQGAKSGYRDLSGYYRKHENSQDNNSPRGGDDQKSNRRKKSNRNRKGNATDVNERSQQEMPSQEDLSGKPRENRNRRRRNNNNTTRNREDRKEVNQREDGSSSQDQGPAFPALPKRDEQTITEKPKDDFDNNPDPAAFWRKRREVEQMEKSTVDMKSNTVVSPVATEHSPLIQEHEDSFKDNLVENQTERLENEWSETPSEIIFEESSQDYQHEIHDEKLRQVSDEIHQESPQESVQEILKNFIPQEQSQELPTGISGDVVDDLSGIKSVPIEKRVNWQDLQKDEDKSTFYTKNDNRYENMDANKHDKNNLTHEKTTKPIYLDNRLKDFVIEIGDDENVAEEQNYNSVNQNLFDPQRNFEILKNPDRQEVQGYVQAENTITENETTVEQVVKEQEKSPVFRMGDHTVLDSETELSVDQNDRQQEEEDVQPTESPDHVNHHPVTAVTIQNEILNGNIAYSNDPEGKDLPKDMEIVRHLYNCGIYMYQYFSGVNNVFPGTAPMSPMYPMMNPNAMYAMHQSFQNRAMMMPQNMYPQMQQPAHDETQHQQSLGEETRETDSPVYKPSISHHHPPSYHTMVANQQAMLNMNYGQMFAAAGRPLYSNYNMFHQRPPFSKYPPNKVNFNRQMGRKYNKYTRNDNHLNVKLQNLQTGYGQYSKDAE